MFDDSKERVGKAKVGAEPKIIEKILPNAVRVKEILSANKVTGVQVLNLDSQNNLKGEVTREVLETLAAEDLKRVYAPIESVLKYANLTLDDISQVEIIGGSVRVPKVNEILKEKLGDKLGTHMNGDDSTAFGAAFIAANFSSNFKLAQKIELYHGNTYEMIIKLQNSPHNETFPICSDEVDFAHECVRKLNKTASLYRVRHGYDISKTVSLKHDGDFDISVYQKFPEEEMKLLVNYKITDLYASLDFMKNEQITDKPKVNLRFVLNKRGMLSFKVR